MTRHNRNQDKSILRDWNGTNVGGIESQSLIRISAIERDGEEEIYVTRYSLYLLYPVISLYSSDCLTQSRTFRSASNSHGI